MPRKTHCQSKFFVLDTNVLLHDPNSILRFADNDIAIPFVTLEELDKHKTGQQDLNRNARAAIRLLEQATQQPGDMNKGFALNALNHGGATGRLYLLQDPTKAELAGIELEVRADNRILEVMLALRHKRDKRVVTLVSKDINLRVKAKAMGFVAEDYMHDHAVEDADLLYRGYRVVTNADLETHLEHSWSDRGLTCYRLRQFDEPLRHNEFLLLDNHNIFRVDEASEELITVVQEVNFMAPKNEVWGVVARNDEQSYALSLLMNEEIDFVTLLGPAGTGKTLLTLAAGLTQVLELKRYNEIIFTRATVPLGEDIGFLPGTEEEKMAAWMGALDDNLEFLSGASDQPTDWHKTTTMDLVRSRIKVKAITFMRGRTFQDKLIIIDEAQNLTPKQMKALVTRCGPGTKIICLGNLSQIDSPYLSETSSGLTFAVEGFKGWKHYGHLILEKGERSRLANYANEHL